MLYDGCLRFLHQTSAAMREGHPGVARARQQRAEAIISELLSTLDLEQGGQIASRLQGIYVFCLRHLLEAGRTQDADMVDEVAGFMAELRESWAQLDA
jgi:flagellar protein FliS